MLSPKKFAEKAGLSYEQVLNMCKKGEIDAIKTTGGHFKIAEKELNKFKQDSTYVSKEEYMKVIRENERLKTLLLQTKNFINNLNS